MSDRLTRRIGALSRDTATVPMPSGAAIRDRGERRGRRLVVVSTVAVFAVLVAVGAGAYTLVDRRGAAPAPPGGSPTPTPTASGPAQASPSVTSTRSVPPVTSIPASAMLRLSDLKLGTWEPQLQQMAASDLVKLRVCNEGYPSDGLRTANRRMAATTSILVQGTDVANDIEEQLFGYRSDGAPQFMAELRSQISRCPGTVSETTKRWTVIADNLGGDESALIEVRQLCRYLDDQPPRERARYVAVVRVGNLIVILADHAWECGGGQENTVRQLMPKALQRATAVR